MTAAVVVCCLIATAIVAALARHRIGAIFPAGLAVVLGQTIGILAIRPWKARPLGRWPMAWLAGRGIAVVGLIVCSALLYSAFRPDPLVFGLLVAVAFFASLLAEVWAYAAQSKDRIARATSAK